jgi:hypothetical protein
VAVNKYVVLSSEAAIRRRVDRDSRACARIPKGETSDAILAGD